MVGVEDGLRTWHFKVVGKERSEDPKKRNIETNGIKKSGPLRNDRSIS